MSDKAFTILLVDDHQLIVDGIKSMFSDNSAFNFLYEANNGLDAMQILQEKHAEIDLIIADVNMPGQTGIELCHYAKTHYHDIKVLILSMYQSSGVIKEALMAEADGYIIKNSGKKEFQQAILRILDGGTYFSEAILPLIYKEYQKEQIKTEALSKLTERELEILKLIVNEMTSEEIAGKLFISKKTVDNHRQSLLSKTNSKSTVGLVKYAIKCGMEVT